MSMLQSRQVQVEKEILALMQTKERLSARVEQIRDALSQDKLGRLRIEELPRRPVAILRRELGLGDDLELPLRHLENYAGLKPGYFLGKVGLNVSGEELRSGRIGAYSALFCLVEPGEEPDGDTVSALPEGKWALLRFTGTHSEAPPHYKRLLTELKDRGEEIAGDGVEFTLVDYGLTEDPELFVTEIQIPVKNA